MTPAGAKAVSSAELGELLLRQSPGCAWLLRRDGTFHEIYGDTRWVFGIGAEELLGVNFTALCDFSGRRAWRARLDRVFEGDTITAETLFSAEVPPVSITLFPIRRPESTVAFAGAIAREIPERGSVLQALVALETDRARLSGLLHAHIAQDLSAAGLQLDLLRMDLAEGAAAATPRIADIQAILGGVIETVRLINRDLNPAIAERVGLRNALEQLAGRVRDLFKGNVRVLVDSTAQAAPETSIALYRIAERAAARATARAGCTAIEILLKPLRSGPALEVRDNAPVCDEEDLRERSLDQMIMRYFADRAGIELRIERTPGKGTVVRALCGCGEKSPA